MDQIYVCTQLDSHLIGQGFLPLQTKVLLPPVHSLAGVSPGHGGMYYCKWCSPPPCKARKSKWRSRNETTRSCYEIRRVETTQLLVAGPNSSLELGGGGTATTTPTKFPASLPAVSSSANAVHLGGYRLIQIQCFTESLPPESLQHIPL